VIAIAVALVGCSYENDLDQLCRIAGELEVDSTVAHEDKMPAALGRWTPFTPRAAKLHHDLAALPLDQVDEAVAGAAYEGWSCPALVAIGQPRRRDQRREP
jgi:hypothetical protein